MNKWFPFNRERKECNNCLFILHHAGGSASTYIKWLSLSSRIEVIPIELPGNGCRLKESYVYDFESIVKNVSEEICNFAGRKKIFLYGHSMGAAMAFEICDQLESLLKRKVNGLIVAGRHAPNYEYKDSYCTDMGMDKLEIELKRIGGTPNEVFDDEQIRDYFLRQVWKAYKLNESFKYKKKVVLAPIWVHYGREDADATSHMMEGWKELTKNECIISSFQGGHFFPLELGVDYFYELQNIILG